MSTPVLLQANGLSVGYERTVVARGLDLDLDRGEVLALLGPNGSGKTTLLLTLAGFLKPIDGSVSMDGADAPMGSPRAMNRAGVVLVPDSRALFTRLSTTENLELASGRRGPSVADALELFPALQPRAKVAAGLLSGGEQQMLAVARALVQGPRVLLIDELSMGLAPVVVESLMPVLRTVADETEAAVVLVEQHVHLALEVADTAMVVVHGVPVLSGAAKDLREQAEALEAAYLGAAPPPDVMFAHSGDGSAK